MCASTTETTVLYNVLNEASEEVLYLNWMPKAEALAALVSDRRAVDLEGAPVRLIWRHAGTEDTGWEYATEIEELEAAFID